MGCNSENSKLQGRNRWMERTTPVSLDFSLTAQKETENRERIDGIPDYEQLRDGIVLSSMLDSSPMDRRIVQISCNNRVRKKR